MLFGNDPLFSLVRSAKLGRVTLEPVLARLRDWIHSEFQVSVIHIVFDHVEFGPFSARPRLNVILETDSDFDSWKQNVVTIRPEFEQRVISKFIELAASGPAIYDIDGLFLILDNFADACLCRASHAFLDRDANRVTRYFSLAHVWKIDGFARQIAVFFDSEERMRLKAKDGTCEEISKQCFQAMKPYDEFGYLTDDTFRLRFDSKENLDKRFKGNLFYYWR
jgi:hypothetical protein